MPTEKVTVLLVGKTPGDSAETVDYLKSRGCVVRSAVSFEEAAGLLKNRKFDLVLSDFLISDESAYRLLPLLSGTETSMFISDAVDDGCWWMSASYEGQDRTKEPGMHPSEFKARLDHLLIDKLRDRPDRKLVAQGQMRSKSTRNSVFARHLLVVFLACLAALGIFLFGLFAHTQPQLTRSLLQSTPRNGTSHQSKSALVHKPSTRTTSLRFCEREKEVMI